MKVVSRRTLVRDLETLYRRVRAHVAMSLLQGEFRWCLQFDMWRYDLVRSRKRLTMIFSDKNMNGFLGMTAQWIVDGELITNAIAMRHLPKGDTGHTIDVIHDAVKAELRELAQLIPAVTNYKFYCEPKLIYALASRR